MFNKNKRYLACHSRSNGAVALCSPERIRRFCRWTDRREEEVRLTDRQTNGRVLRGQQLRFVRHSKKPFAALFLRCEARWQESFMCKSKESTCNEKFGQEEVRRTVR